MSVQFISFFHNSYEYREEFTHRELGRPCFYWFSDRFHTHYGFNVKYFYLFVKNPVRDNIAMRARQDEKRDFNDLYSNFLNYRNSQLPKLESGELKYAEPPIIMSFEKIIPDLIAKYHEDTNEYEIIKPITYTNVRFKLFDEAHKHTGVIGIPYTEVPELLDALPVLKESLPFQKPESIDGKYIYDNWIPMWTEKNGTWL